MVPPRLAPLLVLAMLAAPATARATGAPVATATRDQRARAQQLFVKAKAELEGGRVAPALDGFRQSYAIVASPNSHLFVARCLATLGRAPEAWGEYEATIDEAARAAEKDKKYRDTQTAAEGERDALRSSLAFVEVRVHHAPPDATVEVAGREIPFAALGKPVPAPPGAVTIALATLDGAKVERTVTIDAGKKKSVDLDAAPAPPEPKADADAGAADGGARPWRTAMWSSGVVSVAGFFTFAVAAPSAQSRLSKIHDECTAATPCPASRESELDDAKRDQRIGWIGLGVGVAGLGVAVTSYFLDRASVRSHEAKHDDKDASAVRAHVAAGPAWIGVAGSF